MSDYSPSRLVSRDEDGTVPAAETADDALEDDPATTIGEVPIVQDGQRDKEALAQGLFHLFRPAIDNIDGRVKAVRQSQVELRAHIDNLAEDLRRISDCRVVPIDLEPYVKKLLNTRRRVLALANHLQTVQDRVNKINYYVARDKTKRNQMVKTSTSKMIDEAAAAAAASSASTAGSAHAPSGGASAATAVATLDVDPVTDEDESKEAEAAEGEEKRTENEGDESKTDT